MIIENVNITNNNRVKVTRVCDSCGKKEITHMSTIWGGRKRRGNNKDYCKKCSYKYRKLEHPKMEKSASWNGGRYLNENGYYRVYMGNGKYKYEHKMILSEHLNIDISVEEKVHHIDGNKINNNLDNLYLCVDKKEHWACHQSLEDVALKFLKKHVWFDSKAQLYVSKPCKTKKNNVNVSDLQLYNTYEEARRVNGKKYVRFTNRQEAKKLGSTLLHVVIAERIIGRELSKREVVHHIDGNSLNNKPCNLCIMNRSQHKICHYSLQNCAIELFQKGIITFNKGKYYV